LCYFNGLLSQHYFHQQNPRIPPESRPLGCNADPFLEHRRVRQQSSRLTMVAGRQCRLRPLARCRPPGCRAAEVSLASACRGGTCPNGRVSWGQWKPLLPSPHRTHYWHRVTRMAYCFPSDSDGDALRRVIRDGSDLSKPMFIDFQIAVPNEATAKALANVAIKLGYRVSTYASPKCRLPWTCQCSTRMLATYEAVVAIQEELGEVSAEFGGHPDGWGTFGNGPNGQPPVRQTD
jgi:hypothetical protein